LAGVAGPTGATGAAGAQGGVGQTGAQGMGGSIGAGGSSNPSWSYTFGDRGNDILSSDRGKARDIVNYVNENPSSRVTIDGPNPRYVRSVVEALTDGGVSSARIQTGAFTDPRLRNAQRVDVMVSN
jgi:hypothetical protein